MKTLKIDPRNANLGAMIDRGTSLHGHVGPVLRGPESGWAVLALKLLGQLRLFRSSGRIACRSHDPAFVPQRRCSNWRGMYRREGEPAHRWGESSSSSVHH